MDGQKPMDWWGQLKDLVKHIFLGAGLFLLLAIPAIALDFFNQGVHLLAFTAANATDVPAPQPQRTSAADPKMESSSPTIIKVSRPVSIVLEGFEYVLLGVDLLGIGAYLLNTLWAFLRSLTWK
jgi:hypothetical protein